MIGAEQYARERIKKLAVDFASCLPSGYLDLLLRQIEIDKPIPIPADLADFYDHLMELRGYRGGVTSDGRETYTPLSSPDFFKV